MHIHSVLRGGSDESIPAVPDSAFQVDGRRKYLIAESQYGTDQVRPTEKVPVIDLVGADGDFVLSEEIADSMSLERIADRSRCAVRIT